MTESVLKNLLYKIEGYGEEVRFEIINFQKNDNGIIKITIKDRNYGDAENDSNE